jgi:hypothetical protein
MAEGIQFANGLALDADESHIYVCQTTGCNVIRYPIRANGTLGAPEPYGPVLGAPFPRRRERAAPERIEAPASRTAAALTSRKSLGPLVAANRIGDAPSSAVVPIIRIQMAS